MASSAVNIVGEATLRQIINRIKDGSITRIAILSGAGISCAAGIPDFRSPGGMYDTLRPELLTATPEQQEYLRNSPLAVVKYDLFQVNQFPYMEVRRPFILGTMKQEWKATLSHFFIKVLHDKGLLQRLYTQNIDGLDFQLELPADKIVNLHGSLGEVSCEFCGAGYPVEEFCEEVRKKIKNIYDPNDAEAPKESSNILCKQCEKPGVKPNTVMYGRSLPGVVWKKASIDFPNEVDLLLVVGTSLTVSPANMFVMKVKPSVPRILLNRDVVGEDLGMNFAEASASDGGRDAFLGGDCDNGFLFMARELGWLEDLRKYSDRMCPSSASAVAAAAAAATV